MKRKSVNDNILIKLVGKDEKTTDSGIVYEMTTSKEDIVIGEVITAVDCTEDYDPVIKKGDIVEFDKYQAVEIDKKEALYVINENSILFIIKK